MIKAIQVFVVTVFTSLFFFPFSFSSLPAVNTKMVLAVLGLMVFVVDRLNNRTQAFEKRFCRISIWALGVSFCSFLSMTLNDTPDNSYLGYIVSMWVWLFAAYFCINLMKMVHGKVTVETVGCYLTAVAFLQCSLGLIIHLSPIIKDWADTHIAGLEYVGGMGRLYGIDCSFDVGGGRLGATIIIIAFLILQSVKQQESVLRLLCLVSVTVYILVIGNMIGRTTTVGAAIALGYLFLSLLLDPEIRRVSVRPFIFSATAIVCIGVIFCTGLYNMNVEARQLIRYGFEGFFNYFEHGRFETVSTNMLSEGLIFPDNLRTWIIGDGYMAGGANDPYYIGPADYGFYMNTDAGYSRFLFYFGLTGLSVFILFFLNVCKECMNRMKDARFLFVAILVLGLCIWVKVSTDIFLVFALFLCIGEETGNKVEQHIDLRERT